MYVFRREYVLTNFEGMSVCVCIKIRKIKKEFCTSKYEQRLLLKAVLLKQKLNFYKLFRYYARSWNKQCLCYIKGIFSQFSCNGTLRGCICFPKNCVAKIHPGHCFFVNTYEIDVYISSLTLSITD